MDARRELSPPAADKPAGLVSAWNQGAGSEFAFHARPCQHGGMSDSESLPMRPSLVAETARVLREGISSGRWPERLPGERELSAALQVGRNTLRAALAELEREGCLEAPAHGRHRLVRAGAGGALKAGRKGRVGVLSSLALEQLPPQTALLVDEMRRALAASGCALVFHHVKGCFSGQPARALEKLAAQETADLWIVLGSREPMQRWFLRRGLPCLVVGSCLPEVALPSMDADHRAVCRHAGHLLLRHGRKRIALVRHKDHYGGEDESEHGLREALAENARLQVLRHDGSREHVCALVDKALRAEPPPDAFLVCRAVHALTVLTHLMRRGVRVPADAALISRDDHPALRATSPVVPFYTLDARRFARRVVLAVRRYVEGGALPAQGARLMPEFCPGETV